MKVLVVLSAFVAGCLVSPSFGYSYSYSGYAPYSPVAPLFYNGIAPISPYTYNAAILPAPLPYSAAPAVIPAPIAAQKVQYHAQNEAGEASYGHSEPTQSHHAVQDAAGNKAGSFSYLGNFGEHHRTDYVADALGYRAASTDVPVDTPAVAAEKALHYAAKYAAGAHYRRKRSLFSQNIYGWGVPAILANGHIADTPEVAAAKASHFAEVAKASGHPVAPLYPAASLYPAVPTSYYAHAANVVVRPDGFLADTPEVAAAKSAHFAEKAKAEGHYAPAPVAVVPGYYPGQAATVVRPDGFLADTPEVAAAKAAHFAEKAKAEGFPVHGAYPLYTESSGHYAMPVVKPDGFLADTPEVAEAKANHFRELHARGKRSISTPASTALLSPFVTPYTSYPYTPLHTAYSYPYAPATIGYPALKTIINHTPGHAYSVRIDPAYNSLLYK